MQGVAHDFDDEGLVRELAQGCLIEKGADVVYFGHRSIQEFLAAEHLFNGRLAPDQDAASSITSVCRWATEQVCGFLDEFFSRRSNGRDVATAAIDLFQEYVGPVDLDRLTPFEMALRHSSYDFSDLVGAGGVWLRWLSQWKISEVFQQEESSAALLERIYRANRNDEYAAAIHLLFCAVLAGGPIPTGNAVAPLIASLMNTQELLGLLANHAGKRVIAVKSDEHLRTYVLAKSTSHA